MLRQLMFVFAILLALSVYSTGSFAQEREEALVMEAGSSLHKYSVTLFSLSSMDAKRFEYDNPSAFSYTYLGLNYKIDSQTKWALRVPFLIDFGGKNEYGDTLQTDARLHDVHLAYVWYDLGYIGDVEFNGSLKYYLPTSERAQDSKTLGSVRFELYSFYPVGRFSGFQYVAKPQVYLQTQKAYFDNSVPAAQYGYRDPRRTNKIADFEHFIEFVGDINRYFSLKPKAGFDETWYYASESENLAGSHSTKGKLGLGLEIRALKGWNFTVGMENEFYMESYRGRDINPFLPENVSYTLVTNGFLF